jgi:hypothetical protein
MRLSSVALLSASILLTSCATLSNVIQPPRFSVASGRQAELRLVGPSIQNPTGGAAIRIWARVENPNGLGLTLAALRGNLFLEDTRAAAVDFPMGVPLVANQDTIIPLDISIRFSDIPGLADVASRLLTRSALTYRLDGTLTVDAGLLGQPSFGPQTWLRGQVDVTR